MVYSVGSAKISKIIRVKKSKGRGNEVA